jgi:hypothetical protein
LVPSGEVWALAMITSPAAQTTVKMRVMAVFI